MVERVYICQQIVHGRHVGQTYTDILFEQRVRTTNSELISLRKISVEFSLVLPLVTLETYSTPRRAIEITTLIHAGKVYFQIKSGLHNNASKQFTLASKNHSGKTC